MQRIICILGIAISSIFPLIVELCAKSNQDFEFIRKEYMVKNYWLYITVPVWGFKKTPIITKY